MEVVASIHTEDARTSLPETPEQDATAVSPPGVGAHEPVSREPSPPRVQAQDEPPSPSVGEPEEVEEGVVQRPQSEQDPEEGRGRSPSDEHETAMDGQQSSRSAPGPDEMGGTQLTHSIYEPEREAEQSPPRVEEGTQDQEQAALVAHEVEMGDTRLTHSIYEAGSEAEQSPLRVEEGAQDQEQAALVAHEVEMSGEKSPTGVKEEVDDQQQQASLVSHVVKTEYMESPASAKASEAEVEQSATSGKEPEKSAEVLTGGTSGGVTLAVQSDMPETDAGSGVGVGPETETTEAVKPREKRKYWSVNRKTKVPTAAPQLPYPRQLLPNLQRPHQPPTQPPYQRQLSPAPQPPHPQPSTQIPIQPAYQQISPAPHSQPSTQPPHQRQAQSPHQGQPSPLTQPPHRPHQQKTSLHTRAFPAQYHTHTGRHRDASHASYPPRPVAEGERKGSSSVRTWSILPSGQVDSGYRHRTIPIGNERGGDVSETGDYEDSARPSGAAEVRFSPFV